MAHTLLLADDSVTIQRVIELTFADEDIRVVAVSDGERAIAAMAEGRPDIVLVDVAMPGPSGYEVAEHMRRTSHLAGIPVLLLTGAFEPIDQPRADAARCAGILVKPFEPQQVIARVKELLARPSETVGERTAASPASPVASPPAASDAPAPAPAPTMASVDEYFERLDKVFGQTPAPLPAPPVETAAVDQGRAFQAAEAPADPAPQTPSATRPTETPLAAAFLALLDAERDGVSLTPVFPTAAIPEALVAEITNRVLSRLSERVARPIESQVTDPR